jgi:hypothetical protein
MESRKSGPATDVRKPYAAPELKEFGTIAELTATTLPVGPKNDGSTKGNDKSTG